MDLNCFGMDTVSLAGPLDTKLACIRQGGFTQVLLSARDIAGHPGGVRTAVAAVRASGLRVTGLQMLHDFEGLAGHLHDYKVDIAKAMLAMCHALGANVLLVSSSTSNHASDDRDHLVRDLRKLAMLAVPLGIKVGYEALSWGRCINDYSKAWDIVEEVDRGNLGLDLDLFHMLAMKSGLEALDDVVADKICLVKLADFMWQEMPSQQERIDTARHFRVFPGEGVHSEEVVQFVRKLESMGYVGDYSFEVFNDDYEQIPLPVVAERARNSARWLTSQAARGNLLPWTRPARVLNARSGSDPGQP